MDELMRSVNEYLFYEFGFDLSRSPSEVTTSWPFALRLLRETGDTAIFDFEEHEPFFALAGPTLSFVPKAGMSVEDLVQQEQGSAWLHRHQPVSLQESKPSDPDIPSGLVRRDELEQLAVATVGPTAEILEGLYLRSRRSYLGLFTKPGSEVASVGGLGRPVAVEFAHASAWRRLAWGVGEWLHEGNGNRAG